MVGEGYSSCGARASGSGFSGGARALARGPEITGSVAVAHGLSCSVACDIFPDRNGPRVSGVGRRILHY